jgi:hypothetical protein
MFKTTPERRAIVRRSKAKRNREKTPQEREAEREAERKYYRERRRKNAHRLNEKRRARRHRHGQRQKIAKTELDERFAGMTVVSAARMSADATVWRGPGARRERELEVQADAILRKAARESTPTKPVEPPEPEQPRPETVAPIERLTYVEIVAEMYLRKLRF